MKLLPCRPMLIAPLLAIALLAAWWPGRAEAAEPSCTGRTLATAGHEDDTLLFMSPRLGYEIDSGRCVRTVFVTAGDAGLPATYWEGREEGVEAAYAELAGVADVWSTETLLVAGHPLRLRTLAGDPRVSIVFMRLPDGTNGEGTPAYGNQSILKVWCSANVSSECPGTESEIETVDNSTRYTYEGLVDTLRGLIEGFGATQIWTQDYLEVFFGTDHTDHVVTARLTRSAAALDQSPHRLISVWDYKTRSMPVNVTGAALTRKQHAYYNYGSHDPLTCHTETECEEGEFTAYGEWLKREYVRSEETHGVVANAGYGQIVTAGAPVTMDGGESTTESGAAPTYEWTQAGGPTVSLSDPAAAEPSFTMPGHPTLLTFRLIARDGSSVSPPDYVQVRVPSATPDPTAVVGAGATVDSGATVKLDGSESWDPNSLPLSYEWTQTAGPEVALVGSGSARPEFTAPIGPGTLKFSLIVSNGTQHSEAVDVTYQVRGIAPGIAAPAAQSLQVGVPGSVVLRATGSPSPSLAVAGELPDGVAFRDNGDGTATLAGTPTSAVTPAGTSRAFPLTVTATNEWGHAEGDVTLTVTNPPTPQEPAPTPPLPTPPPPEARPPVLKAPSVFRWLVGRRIHMAIEAGDAAPISAVGALPPGLALEGNGKGRAWLTGTPQAAGVHQVTIAAGSGAMTTTRQIRLVVDPPPELSRRAVSMLQGTFNRQRLTILGPRIESAKCPRRLPAGLRCRVSGRHVVLVGVPLEEGTFRLRLRITARAGTVVRTVAVRL